MPTEAKMTIDERRKYLERMRLRYVRAERVERGQLLDEMEAVTELHRKRLIRLLPGDLARRPRRPGAECPRHLLAAIAQPAPHLVAKLTAQVPPG